MVREFWGAPQDSEEQSMTASRPERRVGRREAA
jgi:anaerobic magnesium-protoporphyrin IX monomethyl ester cyclase